MLADHNIKNTDQVYCILSDKSFAYHESKGRKLTTLKKRLGTIFKISACKISFIYPVNKCTAEILI